MKLIDLLVQELPKRGGWKKGADGVVQDADDTEFYFFKGEPPVNKNGGSWWFEKQRVSDWIFDENQNQLSDDHATSIVTREQYEAALAALRRAAWDGAGLPPVGTECEYSGNGSWAKCKVVAQGREHTIINTTLDQECVLLTSEFTFRPIRTEAERKRDEAIKFMSDVFRDHVDNRKSNGQNSVFHAIYEAFKHGKFE